MLVSLCYLKIEIDRSVMMNEETAGAVSSEHPTNPRLIKEHRGQRKPRKIKIENYSNRFMADSSNESKGILPKSSRETTPMEDKSGSLLECLDLDDKTFFSGNPFIEVTKGIMHMYKKNERCELNDGLSKTICLFSVPATLNCHDILNFVAPCHPVLQHIRIIRDGTPNQFMVLLEFRSIESALEFYRTFNGAPYNSLEPDSVCHLVWVSNVEFGDDGLAPVGHTELPTCPVCLDRMDESVDSVLTILCNHAFHANCLIKWGDSTCPVCRCVQTPELTESSVCMECEGTEALWICLICGHVGCGRYQGGHAASHFRTTNHTYALQLGTNRVWDYAGDNFVHRLLQSKSDGKLVDTKSPEVGDGDDEKMDSIQLDFMYTLTSQLDAQRKYYEDRMNGLQMFIDKEMKQNQTKTNDIEMKCKEMEGKLQTLTKEKLNADKKLINLNSKNLTLAKDLADEREMSKALQSNYTSWQTKYNDLEIKFKKFEYEKQAEMNELREQIRDLMFFLEAQNTIANSELKDEIASSSVTIPPSVVDNNNASISSSENSGAKPKNRRKKK